MKEIPSLTSTYFDEAVVFQIGEFRELRAAEELRRIASFNPFSSSGGLFGGDRVKTVGLAIRRRRGIRRSPQGDNGRAQ